jgi:tetratricopeptide (TPR) repeat protein
VTLAVSRRRPAGVFLLALAAAAVAGPAGAWQAPVAVAPARPAVDPFYSSRLREGVAAYDRGDHAEAAASLRVACFGMLDVPGDLAPCLVRLALAQAAAGDRDGFAQTFRRLVEGEELLGLYSQAVLPAGLAAAFEAKVTEWLPAGTLALLRAPSAQPAATAAAPAPPPAAAEPPGSPGSAAPAPAAAAPPRPAFTPADEQALARISAQLAAATSAAEVESAYVAASRLAEQHPTDPRVQHTAAEVAYRASRWADAVRYFRRGGDPGEAQPLMLFYFSVALWESGERTEAAAVMRRCEGLVRQTPFVEAYRRRILGGESAG